jgi:hypothetical protein
VPDLRTTVTELGTGLGMLGFDTIDDALAARPPVMVSVAPAAWDQLTELRAGGAFDADFAAAWANGAAFLSARDGLRGRVPVVVEWKGSHRAPGDEVAPIDLRVDHVYLVSCKYLSRILINPSPAHLFDRLLKGGHGKRAGDNWFETVAPDEHQALFAAAGGDGNAAELPTAERRAFAAALGRRWPDDAAAASYAELCAAVSERSAARWRSQLATVADREAMLWRLLRIGSAPYFVLGSGAAGAVPLRLRVATTWDWRQRFEVRAFDVVAEAGGQPRVGWRAAVRDRATGGVAEVQGHVEVRWSHGRFSGPPEAKVYLDTPHAAVPGYFPLV